MKNSDKFDLISDNWDISDISFFKNIVLRRGIYPDNRNRHFFGFKEKLKSGSNNLWAVPRLRSGQAPSFI